MNFETLDRNYILTKKKNLDLNLRACAGKEMGRPSGVARHRAQLTGGPTGQRQLKREAVRALWVVRLEARSTAEGRRRRRTGRRRARTLAARWGSTRGVPGLQRGRRGGQTTWKTTVRRGAVAAELGVVAISGALLLLLRLLRLQFRRGRAPLAPARGG